MGGIPFDGFDHVGYEIHAALILNLHLAPYFFHFLLDAQFTNLQTVLEGTENRIATERGRYTEIVKKYNVAALSQASLLSRHWAYSSHVVFSSLSHDDVPSATASMAWEEYAQWRESNEAWLKEQQALKNPDGTPYYKVIVPDWNPGSFVLIHYFNDRSETEGNLSPLYTSTIDTRYTLYLYNDTRVGCIIPEFASALMIFFFIVYVKLYGLMS